MFAKSLLIACSAATVAAVKLTAQVSLSSLAGVNIAALSKTELTSLLEATEQAFEDVKSENGFEYLTEAENQARHVQMLSNESVYQQYAAEDETYVHKPNMFSVKTAQEKQVYAGTKPFTYNEKVDPVHDDKNGVDMDAKVQEMSSQILAQQDNLWNTTFPGCTSTYQYIHDQSDWSCQSFFAWDDQWLQQIAYKSYYDYYVASGYITEEYLLEWWNANVVEWRSTLRSHLQCTNEPDNNDNQQDQNQGGDDSNNNTSNCSDVNAPECVWGSAYVTPIKNQGNCGSCYSFSATQILESYAAINGDGLYDLSEQQIVDCGYGNNGGCNGGWPASVLRETINSSTAIMPAEDYEYKATKGRCQVNSKNPSFKIQTDGSASVKSVRSNSVSSFKNALMNGPLAITVDANDKFMGYTSGVLRNCTYGSLNHAVNAIGWTQMGGVEVMKIRNSWGTWWGDEGYIYVAIDDAAAAENGGKGPCGILEYGYFAAAKKI